MCPSVWTPRMRSKIKFCSQYDAIICRILHQTPFCYVVAPRHFNSLSERFGRQTVVVRRLRKAPAQLQFTVRFCCTHMAQTQHSPVTQGQPRERSLPTRWASSALCGFHSRVGGQGCSRVSTPSACQTYGSRLRVQRFRDSTRETAVVSPTKRTCSRPIDCVKEFAAEA